MKKLFILLTSLFIMSGFASGQGPCPDGCTVVASGLTFSQDLIAPDCAINVTYDVYDCGGNISIKLTNYTASGACTVMGEQSIYNYNISSLEEYISLAVIDWYMDNVTGPVPDCPSFNQVVKVYTAKCGIWVGCEYEVEPTSRVCDTGYLPPYPDYGTFPTKVKVWKWQSCGTICCENVYTICRTTSLETGNPIIDMSKVSSGPQGGSTCSGQASYLPRNCQYGCN